MYAALRVLTWNMLFWSLLLPIFVFLKTVLICMVCYLKETFLPRRSLTLDSTVANAFPWLPSVSLCEDVLLSTSFNNSYPWGFGLHYCSLKCLSHPSWPCIECSHPSCLAKWHQKIPVLCVRWINMRTGRLKLSTCWTFVAAYHFCLLVFEFGSQEVIHCQEGLRTPHVFILRARNSEGRFWRGYWFL